MKKSVFFLLLFFISLIYLLLRFNQLENKLTFSLDQGIHLLETFQMVQSGQPRLIGPTISSKIFEGRGFFIGPQYYYVLAILGIVTRWNPLLITQIIIFIELFFWLIFFVFLAHTFNPFSSLASFLFITLSNYFIVHSRFFWNPHFLIPISILIIIFLYYFNHTRRLLFLYLSLILFGLGFSFHYSALIWILFFLYILLKNHRFLKIQHYLILPFFFILGDLPYFIFEIRHQFYNLKTAILVMTQLNTAGEFSPHYLIFPLIVFFAFFVNYLFLHVSKLYIKFLVLTPFLILGLTTFSTLDRTPVPLSHYPGWTYPLELHVINLILAEGCPKNYNIASTVNGDTRSYDLRSLLTIKHCPPLSVDIYPQASTVYLIAPSFRPPQTETVWEISSFKPFTVKSMVKLNDQVILYRLEKTHAPTSKNI